MSPKDRNFTKKSCEAKNLRLDLFFNKIKFLKECLSPLASPPWMYYYFRCSKKKCNNVFWSKNIVTFFTNNRTLQRQNNEHIKEEQQLLLIKTVFNCRAYEFVLMFYELAYVLKSGLYFIGYILYHAKEHIFLKLKFQICQKTKFDILMLQYIFSWHVNF